MSRDGLIRSLRELVENWEARRDSEEGSVREESDVIQDCIDDLKGILPPEE